MTRRRLAAVTALVLAPLAVVSAGFFVGDHPQQAFGVLLTLTVAVLAGWFGLVHRGVVRIAGLVLAALCLIGVMEQLLDRRVVDRLAIVAMFWGALAAAAAAFTIHAQLPRAPRPRRPVLFLNPRSGGGKAERLGLAEEARARGIEPVELRPGDDLDTLVRDAVENGADALAMAGGDGSQAIVAAVAAERGLPFACIPSGTRNHFALDLGVDRNDVVGALDAFVDGGERVVDLGEVNGRVFVNNVSLGVYATAVQRDGYREAKVRTLLATLPDMAGAAGARADLTWTGPHGASHAAGTILLVSNNAYRLRGFLGTGTRPRIDDGVLGIAVIGGHTPRGRRLWPGRLWREWSVPEFEVRSPEPIAAGIDGEATILAPPLRFRARRAALRVRISPSHPGASPSAAHPGSMWEGLRALVAIAAGRDPQQAARPRPPVEAEAGSRT